MRLWRPGNFVRPPESVFCDPELEFMDGFRTYGEYNYLRPGLVSRIKSAHFEKALELVVGGFGRANVIDFGCADGVFLPSLARHFPHVAAVDREPKLADIALRVVKEIAASNVDVICNETLDADALRRRLSGRSYQVAFCLEVLEHVGEPGRVEDLYPAKLRLLDQLLALLDDGGRVVASVPIMVGLPFLIQRAALAVLGGWREPIRWAELWRAVLLRDTSRLEPRWDGGHLGFNHLRLEQAMRGRFDVERRVNLGFQIVYVVRQLRGTAGRGSS
jgi:2-polyprenyl-3-methyl-5-hydroxy-6-metoxy-1,4-benzoquinol methylase